MEKIMILLALVLSACGSITDIGYGRMVSPVVVPTNAESGQEDNCGTTTVPNSYMLVRGVGSTGNMMTAYAHANANVLHAAAYYKVGCSQATALKNAMGMAYGSNAVWRARGDKSEQALKLAMKTDGMFREFIKETAKEEKQGGSAPAAPQNQDTAPAQTPVPASPPVITAPVATPSVATVALQNSSPCEKIVKAKNFGELASVAKELNKPDQAKLLTEKAAEANIDMQLLRVIQNIMKTENSCSV